MLLRVTVGLRHERQPVIILARGVFLAAEVSCWMCTGERQSGRIRAKYLRAILRQEVAYFERTQSSTAEVVNNVSADTLLVQGAMSEKVCLIPL